MTGDSSKAKEAPQGKLFNDPVHGEIELHPLLVMIINTPEFQRLRFIKQMGGVYFVYPGAAHNRFEHSIGVCHLAGEFARKLRSRQDNTCKKESIITDRDVLCVEIAGLCHDLGHGPFSHLFDKMVIPEICKKGKRKEHEDISIAMFEHMYAKNKLESEFISYGLKPDEDIIFIKELINGTQEKMDYKGRNPEKFFLYEIVSNKISGIDVDKWDYFARDCLMLGIKSFFSHRRAMACAKVLKIDEGLHICYRNKEVYNLYDLFSVRNMIHRNACQHRVTAVVEIMIAGAIIAAENSNHPNFKFRGEKKLLSMEDALDDMVAYQQITDEILMKIHYAEISKASGENINEGEFKKAKQLVKSVLERDLYTFIGSKFFEGTEMYQGCTKYSDLKKKIKIEMDNIVDRVERFANKEELKENLVIYPAAFSYGQGEKNPLECVWFFKKDSHIPERLSKEKISTFLPGIFYELQVMIYCKEDIYSSDVNDVFDYWNIMKDCEKKAMKLEKKKTEEIKEQEKEIKKLRDQLPSKLQELETEIEEGRKRKENDSMNKSVGCKRVARKEAQRRSATKRKINTTTEEASTSKKGKTTQRRITNRQK